MITTRRLGMCHLKPICEGIWSAISVKVQLRADWIDKYVMSNVSSTCWTVVVKCNCKAYTCDGTASVNFATVFRCTKMKSVCFSSCNTLVLFLQVIRAPELTYLRFRGDYVPLQTSEALKTILWLDQEQPGKSIELLRDTSGLESVELSVKGKRRKLTYWRNACKQPTTTSKNGVPLACSTSQVLQPSYSLEAAHSRWLRWKDINTSTALHASGKVSFTRRAFRNQAYQNATWHCGRICTHNFMCHGRFASLLNVVIYIQCF